MFNPFCLHWSCSPSSRGLNSQGGATQMQAKWIKLDLDGVIAIMTNLLTEH